MKKVFAISVLMGMFATALAQSYALVSMHAWAEPNLTGVKPNTIVREGNGDINSNPSSKFNYYIYAEYRDKMKFTMTKLWINGLAYDIKTEKVGATPVIHDPTGTGTGGRQTTLVPSTHYQVLQLFPSGAAKPVPIPGWVKKLVGASELVIRYQWKGKTWYYALPKINRLDPIAGV